MRVMSGSANVWPGTLGALSAPLPLPLGSPAAAGPGPGSRGKHALAAALRPAPDRSSGSELPGMLVLVTGSGTAPYGLPAGSVAIAFPRPDGEGEADVCVGCTAAGWLLGGLEEDALRVGAAALLEGEFDRLKNLRGQGKKYTSARYKRHAISLKPSWLRADPKHRVHSRLMHISLTAFNSSLLRPNLSNSNPGCLNLTLGS